MEVNMKKTYQAPEVSVMDFQMDKPVLLDVSASGSLEGTENGGDGSGMDADAKDRGSWGDIW